MLRAFAFICFILFASQASAQNCPDFYRFVDFGLKDKSGKIYRGGTVFRAENFDGEDLLLTDNTDCISVQEISKDGHGNPIPVVKSIAYNPQKANISLEEFNILAVDDTKTTAEKNASDHIAILERNDTTTTQGENFLCAMTAKKDNLSCQLVSPYSGNIPLVIYCNTTQCKMPILAINKQLQASASWKIKQEFFNNPKIVATKMANKVQQIHDFLKPLSAAL